jgi:16S rRNA (uracil1498-N3)-methyltransferase
VNTSREAPPASAGPRIFCETALQRATSLALPPGAARHVQVLRLQPGAALRLFDGRGGEYEAVVERMGRSDVAVHVLEHHAIEREPAREVHLALGMPANERMDWLVEKAAELGAASIQPLMTQHSVLRVAGERAQKKQAHWQQVAVAACEQCGRNRVPVVHAVSSLEAWLGGTGLAAARMLLSPSARAASRPLAGPQPVCVLSGPEGGLSAAEERLAISAGFQPVRLGERILRAETAPLAALTLLTLGP